ncbi:MAG: 3-dehydroquinate synthase [Clostridia bacterium]|nr:3-dehydroquinate synthase [Clostridia bacterium]
MYKVEVNASKSYEVIIERGGIKKCGDTLLRYFSPSAVCIVSDTNVAPLYLDTVKTSLERSGFTVNEFIFPAGEESKTPETLFALWRKLASVPLTRTDIIVALGGGVTGDMAGFAAATYLRGIKYVQIPTTLLAMVDSSVGGKTAVDLPDGKNLCGAFCQPSLVICDTDTLNTLPPQQYSCGMAEVIKYGMIDRPVIFELISKNDVDALVYECVCDKRDKVEEDEFDNGVRRLLNLGHTFGHAIERLSNFTLGHGQAVAIGMCIITRYAVNEGLCDASVLTSLLDVLKKYDLPTSTDLAPEDIAAAALGDKKREGGTVDLIVPLGLGNTVRKKHGTDELVHIVRQGM